jgi:hypothetical protein
METMKYHSLYITIKTYVLADGLKNNVKHICVKLEKIPNEMIQ